jgi:Fe2+ transport system protein FeoA
MRSLHLAFTSDVRRSLADLDAGEHAIVANVDVRNAHRMDRLLAFGVTPGASVTVLQTFPGVIFLCDQTELAVEREVASAILIRRAKECIHSSRGTAAVCMEENHENATRNT